MSGSARGIVLLVVAQGRALFVVEPASATGGSLATQHGVQTSTPCLTSNCLYTALNRLARDGLVVPGSPGRAGVLTAPPMR